MRRRERKEYSDNEIWGEWKIEKKTEEEEVEDGADPHGLEELQVARDLTAEE